MTNQDTDATPKVRPVEQRHRTMAAELTRMMEVRRAALEPLRRDGDQEDAPMATMEEALVPLYMYHRYAVESAASAVGGQDYIYAFRGDDRIPTKWVPAAQQRAALEALSSTLKPSELALPKAALDEDPAAAVRLGHASRAVRAQHGRHLRSDQPGGGRRRHDDRLPAGAGPRRAHGGAARARSVAAGPRRRHRGAAQRDVHAPRRPRPTSRRSAAPRRACWPSA